MKKKGKPSSPNKKQSKKEAKRETMDYLDSLVAFSATFTGDEPAPPPSTTGESRKKKPAAAKKPPSQEKQDKENRAILRRLKKPAIGGQYGAPEIAKILSELPKKSTDKLKPSRRMAIAALSGNHAVFGRKSSQLDAIVKQHNDGLIVPNWGTKGRKPLLSQAEVKAAITKVTSSGASVTFENMEAELNAKASEKDATIGRGGVTRKTVEQYMNMGELYGDIRDDRAVKEKSDTRGTAENSVLSMVTNFLATTYARVLVCEEGGVKNPPPPGNDVATLWSEALGVPLSCLGLVDDSLTTNMDGTSLFVFEGKARKEKKGQFVIAPPDIAEKGKSCSTFKRGTHTPFDGVQAELMITTAADGTVAPLVVKFKGLTPDEVTGALFVDVPRLSYSRNNTSTGTVMFVGSSSGEDPDSTPAVLSSEHYHSKILLPWIREKRREFGWHDGTPVSPHMAAVASCGGAQDILKAIIKCLTCDEADLVQDRCCYDGDGAAQ